MSPYQFWLSETDEHGNPLDSEILKAARELGPTFFSYRQREIGCESLANTIAQAAVEAASNATHLSPDRKHKSVLVVSFHAKDEQVPGSTGTAHRIG